MLWECGYVREMFKHIYIFLNTYILFTKPTYPPFYNISSFLGYKRCGHNVMWCHQLRVINREVSIKSCWSRVIEWVLLIERYQLIESCWLSVFDWELGVKSCQLRVDECGYVRNDVDMFEHIHIFYNIFITIFWAIIDVDIQK